MTLIRPEAERRDTFSEHYYAQRADLLKSKSKQNSHALMSEDADEIAEMLMPQRDY